MTTPRHQRPTKLTQFLFGADYYPEHWTEADRRDDPQRMAAAGVNVVRMAEFAWDRIEPAPGRFDFSLFDQTIERLAEKGIRTILCTPTATPPRWLTCGHDDWMRVDEQGRPMSHGSRQHTCTNNPDFRAESRRITQAMANHYRHNPAVIGWQTDNELFCHISLCYCGTCQKAFQQWLARRYETPHKLNAAWGTAFWAQTYDSFDQVPLSFPSGRPTHANPSHELDHYRFLSDGLIDFQREQVEILRRTQSRWWITHNGLFGHIDYWKFTQDLDFLGVDIYPCFAGNDPGTRSAMSSQRCRAASGSFIVPEQQAGAGGQKSFFLRNPAPGQMRLWAWQSVANGADGMIHFRWRTCRFGAEEYWCGVLDHDNVPRRRYQEFAREGREFNAAGPLLLGTTQDCRAAILVEADQDDAWLTMPLNLPSPDSVRRAAFAELCQRHLPCGLVQTADSFDGLKLLIVPSMPMMDNELAAKLQQFVEQGGTLVLTARSATRNRDNQVFAETPPGLISGLCGASVEEFGREEAEPGHRLQLIDGPTVTLGGGYEVLKLSGARAVAVWQAPQGYGPSAADGLPAISLNRVGRGNVFYVGTYLDAANVAPVMDAVMAVTDLQPLAETGPLVEITCRRNADRRLIFLLNHARTEQTVRGLPQGTELLASKACTGEVTLPPYEVAVLHVQPQPAKKQSAADGIAAVNKGG